MDRKFIVAMCDRTLICFDQHAVHERVRVERLQRWFRDNRARLPLATHPPPQPARELSMEQCACMGGECDDLPISCLVAVCFDGGFDAWSI